MDKIIPADASPEKRLFISLITRDISLIDAFLDLIDNSINSALEPIADKLKTAENYKSVLTNKNTTPKVNIGITVNATKIEVSDNATGISLETARSEVFRFGKAEDGADKSDRLSVYGIGLKRALFKCGNKIKITSEHKQGGFNLDLDVAKWERLNTTPWTFDITARDATKASHGTKIVITDLHDDVKRRIEDGLFLSQLKEKISRTYSFFINRIVTIKVNNESIESEDFQIGDNASSESFKSKNVSCSITAGISGKSSGNFRDKDSGWFIFCNGRTVLSSDKSLLTGWAGGGLPIFQPKHRPFVGFVFFVSPDPETLPWTTTKSSINEDSLVWQEAKRHMISVGRNVVKFLDSRYSEDGTEIASSELQGVAGNKIGVLTAAVATTKHFQVPKKSPLSTTTIQYKVKLQNLKKIESYLRRPGMGGSGVGRYLRNPPGSRHAPWTGAEGALIYVKVGAIDAPFIPLP